MILRIFQVMVTLFPVLILTMLFNQLMIGVRGQITINDMQREVDDTQLAIKSLPFLNINEPCDVKNFEAYEEITNAINELKEEEIFGNIVKKALYDYLKQNLRDVKNFNMGKSRDKQKGLICKYTAGLHCPTTSARCECRPGSIFNIVERECFIHENTPCDSQAEFEPPLTMVSCRPPLKCVVTKSSRFLKLDRDWPDCSTYNLWAFVLTTSLCTCEVPAPDTLKLVKRLHNQLLLLPPLSYDSTCDIESQRSFSGLERAIAHGNQVFYQRDQFDYLYNKLTDATSDFSISYDKGEPIFCDRKSAMFCDIISRKCICFPSYEYIIPQKKCLPRSGTLCNGGEPFPCISGERCLFKEPSEVQCLKENLDEVERLNFHIKIYKNCQCSSKKFQAHIDNSILSRMKSISDSDIKKKVHEVRDTIVEVVAKGTSCDWNHNIMYFEMEDLISANLEFVFYRTETYQTFRRYKDNGTMIKVCDRKKSMRCGFLSDVCECPIESYLLHEIHSIYNPTTDSCQLRPGSMCHATLTEWLPCSQGEKCIYQDVPVLCNRKNKKVVTENNLRFKTGYCYCSDKPHKSEFDLDSIRKFSDSKKQIS